MFEGRSFFGNLYADGNLISPLSQLDIWPGWIVVHLCDRNKQWTGSGASSVTPTGNVWRTPCVYWDQHPRNSKRYVMPANVQRKLVGIMQCTDRYHRLKALIHEEIFVISFSEDSSKGTRQRFLTEKNASSKYAGSFVNRCDKRWKKYTTRCNLFYKIVKRKKLNQCFFILFCGFVSYT